jgi:unsaturated rhamnogalacturonyl hydrolase
VRQLNEIAFTRRTVLAGVCASMTSGCISLGSPEETATDAETIGRLAAREWASRPEITPYVIPEAVAPHYAEACTALGVARLAAALGDPAIAALVQERWERAAPMENTGNHVDANVIGVWGLVSGTATGRQYGLALADKQWADVDETGLTRQARFWIDDIYMIASLQAQAWRETGEPRFLDRASLMATRYLARLQQPSGLFHHALDSPFFWARGNGWVAAGLAELLSVLPRSHPHHAGIRVGFARMAEALVRKQRPDGLWGQLIDRPEFWSESSGSAMFAYAFLRGAHLGFLPAEPYRGAALRAFAGLKPRVEPDGRLQGVCVGTGRGDSLQYYFDRPTVTGDLHGQAPLLWLCSELLA